MSVIPHPDMLVPRVPPDMLASERDRQASEAWMAYADAARSFQQDRTADNAVALCHAYGRFVAFFMHQDGADG